MDVHPLKMVLIGIDPYPYGMILWVNPPVPNWFSHHQTRCFSSQVPIPTSAWPPLKRTWRGRMEGFLGEVITLWSQQPDFQGEIDRKAMDLMVQTVASPQFSMTSTTHVCQIHGLTWGRYGWLVKMIQLIIGVCVCVYIHYIYTYLHTQIIIIHMIHSK